MFVSHCLARERDTERKPRCHLPIEAPQTLFAAQVADGLLQRANSSLHNFLLYVVDQTRGMAYVNNCPPRITIPLWLFDEDIVSMHYGERSSIEDAVTYYVAHELSHLIAHPARGHGKKFMYVLSYLCPVKLQWHEHTYKPRNAAAAGVAK